MNGGEILEPLLGFGLVVIGSSKGDDGEGSAGARVRGSDRGGGMERRTRGINGFPVR